MPRATCEVYELHHHVVLDPNTVQINPAAGQITPKIIHAPQTPSNRGPERTRSLGTNRDRRTRSREPKEVETGLSGDDEGRKDISY